MKKLMIIAGFAALLSVCSVSRASAKGFDQGYGDRDRMERHEDRGRFDRREDHGRFDIDRRGFNRDYHGYDRDRHEYEYHRFCR